VYDRDDSGREGAQKVAEARAAAGQTVAVHVLPADVGPGGDVTTLYGNLGQDDTAFRAALAALPMHSVGGPETVRERNAAICEGALATLREVQQVASWPWGVVGRLLGGLVAGFRYVVGALTGNGKTTFLMNLLTGLLENQVPTLYFGTEMAPEDLVKKWAALRLGLDEQRVFEGKLDDEERDAVEREIRRLTEQEVVTSSTVARLDMRRLVAEVTWAFDARTGLQPRVLIVDHLHQMSQDREELEHIAKGVEGDREGTPRGADRCGPAQPGPGSRAA
jgi:hypothetical protein